MLFKEFLFAFTNPFSFSDIMKALILVEHLSQRLIFKIPITQINRKTQGFSLHLGLQDLNGLALSL